MLCHAPGQSRAESEYHFVAPDGQLGASLPRPGKNAIRACLYLPEQRVLVITEAWQTAFSVAGKKSAVWIHDLVSGDSHRLVKDQYLGDEVGYIPLKSANPSFAGTSP